MAIRNLPHIFVDRPAQAEPYTPPPRRITGRSTGAPDNRRRHGESLRSQLTRAAVTGLERRADRTRVEGALDGIYVTFDSFPGIELAIESLDVRQGKLRPELRTVRSAAGPDGGRVELATVFIPDGKLGYFLQRVQQYLKTAESERPRNMKLLDRVQAIGLASIQHLWTDRAEDFPAADAVVWWEVWLRRRDGQETERLRSFAAIADIAVGSRTLSFPNESLYSCKLQAPSSRPLSMSWTILRNCAHRDPSLRCSRARRRLIREAGSTN